MKKSLLWIRKAFDFSQTEARGFVVLLVILGFFILLLPAYNYFSTTGYANFTQDIQLLDSLEATFEAQTECFTSSSSRQKKANTVIVVLAPFNPNTCSAVTLQNLGLGKQVVNSILKYRAKGGKFVLKKDLAKIYGLSPDKYAALEKYIDLPKTKTIPVPAVKTQYKERPKTDINIADTTSLKALKGIGSKLASRIIKYRNALGGFVFPAQFAEVYGLDSLALTELEKHSYIGKEYVPEKIAINTIDFEKLSTHPYIGKKYAVVILNYRKQHGPFYSFEELLKVKAVPESNLRKIVPYLSY